MIPIKGYSVLYSYYQVDISSPVAYVMSVREDQELNHVKVTLFNTLLFVIIICKHLYSCFLKLDLWATLAFPQSGHNVIGDRL